MYSQLLTLFALSSSILAAPTERSLHKRFDYADDPCTQHTIGAVCFPRNDAPGQPIGDHIGVTFVGTGVPGFRNSTGISSKLRSQSTGKVTQLSWTQRDSTGYSNGSYYDILTSHNGGFVEGTVPNWAFLGDGQFPCSLLDDYPGGEDTFEWLLTHYWGADCTYTNPSACHAFIRDVPPFQGNRTILLKDNASVCGR